MREPLSLYIHIPFCVRKCLYCDFVSYADKDYEFQRQYVDALLQEIESYRAEAHNYMVDTIFIGGGTPSSLQEGLIASLMQKVRTIWDLEETPEITIECNPGTVNRDKLNEYLACGINRISFGLQSANNEELKRIGRIHNYEQFVANYHLAREMGFRNINVDLMSALPGQTMATYGKTLAKVLALEPEHISAYSLIVEEGTPLAASKDLLAILPSENQDRAMYQYTKKILHSMGYERYEISNYSRPGYECRHNIGYWTGRSYLGLGLHASSYYRGQRFHNIDYPDRYIEYCCSLYTEEKKFPAILREEIQTVTLEDQMEEFMYLGLRLTAGIREEEFQTRFGRSLYEVYGEVIHKHMGEQLLEEKDGRLLLTEKGIDVSNYVFADFLLDREMDECENS